ncbi:MAG: glycosyltransferase family 2 protein [Cuspidothrix sp.]
MNKLLTIAIPTYNRAKLLDKQLDWLAKAIKGFESECEIIVSDNCSKDDTQKIIKKWQLLLSNVTFHNNKNPENVGVMRNIAYCINAAKTKYVWTISDDDRIGDQTIDYIIKTLIQEPDLSLLILNFSCRHEVTNELLYDRCYKNATGKTEINGKAVFEKCIQENRSGIQLMSAEVYKTELAQSALKRWPDGVKNLDYQVYLTAFCAFYGSVKISKEAYLENAFGTSHWMLKPKLLLQMQYTYSPQVNIKLIEIGYSKAFCHQLVRQHFYENNWRVFFGALKRWPIIAVTTLIPYLGLVGVSALESAVAQQEALESRTSQVRSSRTKNQ